MIVDKTKEIAEYLDNLKALKTERNLPTNLTKKHIENAKIHMMGCVKING
jgi:hypothetical protein